MGEIASGCAASVWQTTVPAYPAKALEKREGGKGVVHVTTDAIGWVRKANMVESTGSKILDAATVKIALAYWEGPPGATADIPVDYQLPPVGFHPPVPKEKPAPWRIPSHPYPQNASDAREQGNGVVRAVTNAKGQVKEATLVQSTGHKTLDVDAVNNALKNWSGPASTSADVPVRYKLSPTTNESQRPAKSGVGSTQAIQNGSGIIRISTDDKGRVVRAAVTKSSGSLVLDKAIIKFAREKWSGPPYDETSVPFAFRLR